MRAISPTTMKMPASASTTHDTLRSRTPKSRRTDPPARRGAMRSRVVANVMEKSTMLSTANRMMVRRKPSSSSPPPSHSTSGLVMAPTESVPSEAMTKRHCVAFSRSLADGWITASRAEYGTLMAVNASMTSE